MLLRLLSRLALHSLIVFFAAVSIASGCSRQEEGERCDKIAAGDDDCNDGLVCKICGQLADHEADRCCPPGTAYNDSRCEPASTPSDVSCSTTSGSGGTGGSDGSGGKSGTGGGAGEAGTPGG